MHKKKWQKPKLIVLVRGKSEEAVLAGCKSAAPGGPVPSQGSCKVMYSGSCSTGSGGNACFSGANTGWSSGCLDGVSAAPACLPICLLIQPT